METTIPLKDMTFDYRDEFDRKSIAEKVIKLLEAEIDFCPMAIDGGWGTGKTEFCHKLINLIKTQDAQRRKAAQETAGNASQAVADTTEITSQSPLPPERAVIYLNAFASETVDDPLLCILAAIRAEFPDENTKREICQKAVPVVKTLCKVAGKAMFAHAFKQDLEDVSEAVAEAASDGVNSLIDQTVDKLLDQYADAQKNLDALKAVIATATAQRPILFFIDELDRCRPDFALSILELVKHVFDIPGIKFIFVVNLEQLKAAIRKRYGQDVDADVYLEKFFKFSFTLPTVFGRNLSENCAFYLLEKFGCQNFIPLFYDRRTRCYEMTKKIIENNNVTLRGIESIIRNIKIFLALKGERYFEKMYDGYMFIELISILIFTLNKDLSDNYILEKPKKALIEKFFGKIQHDEDDIYYVVMESFYIADDLHNQKNMQAEIEHFFAHRFPPVSDIARIIKENLQLLNFS